MPILVAWACQYGGVRCRIAILCVGLVGLGLYAYPGFMSFDSVVQLREARAGTYSDWHPPAMAALWRLVEHVVAGPFGMWLLQTSAFLAGVTLILRRSLGELGAAVAAVAILWFPPIAVTMAVVWKDCQMVGYLALGLGLLVHDRRIASLAVLALATAMRINAFTMTLPLVLVLWQWRPNLVRWRRYALAACAWLAITLVAFGANRALTTTQLHPWYGSLAMFDTVGTLRFSGESDAALARDLADAPLDASDHLARRIHDAYSPKNGVFDIVDAHLMHQPQTDAERAGIADAWRRAVFGHPRAYLWHRWRAYRELLAPVASPVWIGVEPIGADLVAFHPAFLLRHLWRQAHDLASSRLMKPWPYLVLAILLAGVVLWRRDILAIAVVGSALVSELALFFLSPTPDFRYSLWLVVCVPLGALLVSGDLLRARRTSGSTARRMIGRRRRRAASPRRTRSRTTRRCFARSAGRGT